MRIGTQELIIILIIVVIVIGPTQIPKLTKMFGKSVKGFKEGLGEEDTENGKADRTEVSAAKADSNE